MENGTSIRLELGIDARRFIQQVQLQNKVLETQIEKGIELALEDILIENNFIEMVRISMKKELQNFVTNHVMSYEMRRKLSKSIEDKIGNKLDLLADKIAENLTTALNAPL
jgi:hypothetical protein